MTDKAYEQQGEEIFSEVEILDSYSTSFHEYDTVMFFQLQDFKDKWGDFTVNKIYMAKNIGLIKYEMNNGISFERNSQSIKNVMLRYYAGPDMITIKINRFSLNKIKKVIAVNY
jgi:hypothetical protein